MGIPPRWLRTVVCALVETSSSPTFAARQGTSCRRLTAPAPRGLVPTAFTEVGRPACSLRSFLRWVRAHCAMASDRLALGLRPFTAPPFGRARSCSGLGSRRLRPSGLRPCSSCQLSAAASRTEVPLAASRTATSACIVVPACAWVAPRPCQGVVDVLEAAVLAPLPPLGLAPVVSTSRVAGPSRCRAAPWVGACSHPLVASPASVPGVASRAPQRPESPRHCQSVHRGGRPALRRAP